MAKSSTFPCEVMLMRVLEITLAAILAVAVLGAGCTYKGYNRAIQLSDGVKEQWGQLESVLEQRYDLIPELVRAGQSVTGDEQKMFSDVAAAHKVYSKAQSIPEKAKAASDVETSLAKVFTYLLVLREKYPELGSNEAIVKLQNPKSEERLKAERDRYNEMAKRLQAFSHNFPGQQFAHMAGADFPEFFEAPAEVHLPPREDFPKKEKF
jgi:LemA protein